VLARKSAKVNDYTVIMYTTGTYILFPTHWFFGNKKANICSKKQIKNLPDDNIFSYKNIKDDNLNIVGGMRRLYKNKSGLNKEIKHKYYFQKASFKVYFWQGGFYECYGNYQEYRTQHRKLKLVDRRISTIGAFLRYFYEQSKRGAADYWSKYPKDALFEKYKKFLRKQPTQPKQIGKPDIGYVIYKLSEAISYIEDGKTVHITKIQSVDNLGYFFDSYNFIRFIANNILKHYLNGNSLCAVDALPKYKKEEILSKSIYLINSCLDNQVCNIDTSKKIEKLFDEIYHLIGWKRVYVHATRMSLKDSDLLAMKECLGFFIFNKNKKPSVWASLYNMTKFYCVDYSKLRYKLVLGSVQRIKDILEFIKNNTSDKE
jgi:hypothetical protein